MGLPLPQLVKRFIDFFILQRISLTIALQGYAIIKKDAKKNPVGLFQRDVQKKLNMCK
jgi:hypothetical protein